MGVNKRARCIHKEIMIFLSHVMCPCKSLVVYQTCIARHVCLATAFLRTRHPVCVLYECVHVLAFISHDLCSSSKHYDHIVFALHDQCSMSKRYERIVTYISPMLMWRIRIIKVPLHSKRAHPSAPNAHCASCSRYVASISAHFFDM